MTSSVRFWPLGHNLDLQWLTFLHCPLEVVQHAVVVNPAEHLLLHQSELLPGGQLPLAGEAGKAGQMIHVALRPADPVRGVNVPVATRTPGAVPPASDRHISLYLISNVRFMSINCVRIINI